MFFINTIECSSCASGEGICCLWVSWWQLGYGGSGDSTAHPFKRKFCVFTLNFMIYLSCECEWFFYRVKPAPYKLWS